MDGVTEGRIVHFVLPTGHYRGAHRAAMIVRVWDGGSVNLAVFPDFDNDGRPDGPYWETSVPYSEGHEFRTWHWIERA